MCNQPQTIFFDGCKWLTCKRWILN
jgi:hypothetical protein